MPNYKIMKCQYAKMSLYQNVNMSICQKGGKRSFLTEDDFSLENVFIGIELILSLKAGLRRCVETKNLLKSLYFATTGTNLLLFSMERVLLHKNHYLVIS